MGALIIALLAAALTACTPTAQAPAATSGGQTGEVVDDISGLLLPQWIGGLRRMEIETRSSPNGPIKSITYSGKDANVYMFTGGRAFPDGANPVVETEFRRAAAAVLETVLKRNGRLFTTSLDLPFIADTPPGRCRIATIEWVCGGFAWRGQADALTDRLYILGYKGKSVLIHGRGTAAVQDNLKSLVDQFSRQMAGR